VAGPPWISDERISAPTMTVYPPRTENTGAAVVVFPGGEDQILAMDLEGTKSAIGLHQEASLACS
jgi:hypothetical protein